MCLRVAADGGGNKHGGRAMRDATEANRETPGRAQTQMDSDSQSRTDLRRGPPYMLSPRRCVCVESGRCIALGCCVSLCVSAFVFACVLVCAFVKCNWTFDSSVCCVSLRLVSVSLCVCLFTFICLLCVCGNLWTLYSSVLCLCVCGSCLLACLCTCMCLCVCAHVYVCVCLCSHHHHTGEGRQSR